MHKFQRKIFLTIAVGLVAHSLPALAQGERRVRRIGYFSLGNARSTAAFLAAFRAGMLELRWLEGRDYIIDARYASGKRLSIALLCSKFRPCFRLVSTWKLAD